MIANTLFSLTIISVVSDNILLMCIQKPLLILKKYIVLVHTLSAFNSFLAHYKVYCQGIPGNVCVQDESMVKPMHTLVLIHYRVERIT